MKKFLYITLAIIICSPIFSQEERIEHTVDAYKFVAQYDTANYCSSLTMTKDGNSVILDSCTDRVIAINDYNLDGTAEKQIVIEYFTGGAHCCDYIVAGIIKNGNFAVKDTLWWGDSGFEIKDINKDGKFELTGVDTRFGYAFTNFAQSIFPIVIYQFSGGKFINVTKKFPDLVEKDMKDFKKSLNDEYLKKGYDCPPKGDETFNTDAGAVQAYLAAITEDYYNLGKMDDAYDYIDKVYKCSDKKKFIDKLKTDYKLK